MTLVLTIATSELRRLAGIDATDTSQDTILDAVQTAEQPALEWMIDATTLADNVSGVRLVLTLGVSELLAGSYLQQMARAPTPLGSLKFGPIQVNVPSAADFRTLGLDLVSVGTARLSPYTRAGIVAAANTAAMEAAKLVVAQAAAAKVAPVDPATQTMLSGSMTGSLFGTLNPLALDTDDSDPPNEFSTGFAILSDDNPDPFFEEVEEGA